MRISFPWWRKRQAPQDEDASLSLFPSEAGLPPLPRTAGTSGAPTQTSTAVVTETGHASVKVTGSAGGVLTTVTTPEVVTVALVLARRVPVSWVEGVAIVDRAVAQLGGGAIPDSSGVVLKADGTIELRGGRPTLGVEQFARTLHALITSDGAPAPLRLLISKWITPENPRAVAEFAKELGYFARPDSEALIKAVYERCLATPAPAALESKTKTTAAEPQRERDQKPRLVPSWAALAAAVVVAAISGAWIAWASQTGSAGSGRIQDLVVRTQDSLKEAGSNLASTIDGSKTNPPAAAAAKPSSPAPSPAATANKAPRSAAPSGGAAAAATAQPTGPRPNRSDTSLPQGSVAAPSLPLDFSIPPVSSPPVATTTRPSASGTTSGGPIGPFESSLLRGPSQGGRVYTSEDADVQPPQMIYPSLPPVLSTNGDVNQMEVVVSPQGLVERVRLISVARRMTDMMLLSGAKTWRFLPAVRDGQPVRYRITVTWSATP
jgi:hypothetical protein